MTKIRLARVGSTHQPYYRIIVADSRNRRDGRFIEILGSYNPHTNPSTVVLNAERAAYWVGVGAQASNTTISLLSKAGVEHSFQVRKKPFKKKETPAETEVKTEQSEAEVIESDSELVAETPVEVSTEEAAQE